MISLKTRYQHFKNRVHARWNAILHEKIHSEFGVRVKYMFFKSAGSDTLVVSFPACAPNAARYNYVRALSAFNCDKMFLLDDFGTNHQGCYLVEDRVESCVKLLICSKLTGGGYKRAIFIGSSKGGYIALNFSFLFPDITVIIGAPQYFLGDYLGGPTHLPNLRYILGDDITEEKKQALNNRLRNRILSSEIKPKLVYIHYSNQEHTYEEHIKWMLTDLRTAGVELHEDIADYKSHSGVADNFPVYMKSVLNDLLK